MAEPVFRAADVEMLAAFAAADVGGVLVLLAVGLFFAAVAARWLMGTF